MALGVTLAPRVVGAVDETASTLPVPVTIAPAASTTTSPTSTSTSTSSSTTTTTVATTPPPTTPPELVPPLVDFRQPAEVANAVQISRVTSVPERTERAQRRRAPIAAGAELPFTGGGTVSIVMSGLTALGIGGVAVWWGSRKRAALIPVETNPTE
jgi:cytoskeletal protein RodZ